VVSKHELRGRFRRRRPAGRGLPAHERGKSADSPPPKLPLKFFGIGTDSKGSARRAFLSDSGDVFIVAEGETVLGRYRILRITNTSLDFEEISSGRRASTPLEEEKPGS
jgi:hypothetical protein